MMTYLLALGLMCLVIAGMAIGVIVTRKPIAGSCGGLNNIGLGGDCEICGGNTQKCDEQKQPQQSTARTELAYDAGAVHTETSSSR